MKTKPDLAAWGKKLRELFEKYKFVLLTILAGIVLLLLPTGDGQRQGQEGSADLPAGESGESFRVEEMERKLERALSQIDGVGDATVVVTVSGGSRQVVAQDAQRSDQESSVDTVIVSKGSGVEAPVVLQELYPRYQGVLVICDGGGEPAVRLKLVEAVSALTGLGADKISICRSK